MAKVVKINLNGHKIVTPASCSVSVKNNSRDTKLVITDSSADKSGAIVNTFVDNVAANDGGICVWARLGDVEIHAGNFENKSNLESTLYVGTKDEILAGAKPTIKVLGGVVKNTAEGEYKWKKDWKPLTCNVINNMKDQQIFLEGGKFYGQDPADGDDNTGMAFVAEGFESVAMTDGGYEIRKK